MRLRVISGVLHETHVSFSQKDNLRVHLRVHLPGKRKIVHSFKIHEPLVSLYDINNAQLFHSLL